MRTSPAGVEEGIKCVPFPYTGLTVLGPAEYKLRVEAEIDRVKRLKCTGVSGIWGPGKAGYKERYGERWEEEIAKVLSSSEHVINVTEIMKHVVEESNKVYAGTTAHNQFFIFHDGLSQWWEPGAQAYLRDVLKFPLLVWGVYKDYTPQRSTTTTQGVVVSRYPTEYSPFTY